MSAAPEDRIREHLERRGGGTSVELRRLLSTWGVTEATSEERSRVARALAGAGIEARPSPRTAAEDDVIELTLSARPADPPTPDTDTRARPRARQGVESESESASESPVEIPRALPRWLLTFGGTFVLLALFLPWYEGGTGGVDVPDMETGWAWLSVLDVALVGVAVMTALVLFTSVLGELGPRALATAATVALAAVTYRIVAPPEDRLEGFILDLSVRVGPFVELLGLFLVVCGAGLLVSSPSREGSVLPDGQAAGDPSS